MKRFWQETYRVPLASLAFLSHDDHDFKSQWNLLWTWPYASLLQLAPWHCPVTHNETVNHLSHKQIWKTNVIFNSYSLSVCWIWDGKYSWPEEYDLYFRSGLQKLCSWKPSAEEVCLCRRSFASRYLENAKGCINKHTAVRIKSL